MTEVEWLTGPNPRKLMDYLMRDDVSKRKGLLFLIACSRHASTGDDFALEAAVDKLEEQAEVGDFRPRHEAEAFTMQTFLESVYGPDLEGSDPTDDGRPSANQGDQLRVLCDLVRCIFGNPFRPVAFDPRWRTETAVALATGIYAGRAFDRLPILADALEEAGCDNADVLSHCRGPGPHARGC